MPTPRNRATGITLLELLVVLSLLAMVMTLAVGGLHLGARSWDAGTTESEAAEEFRTTYRLLRQLIGSMTPAVMIEGKDVKFMFSGEANEMRFVTALPESAGITGEHVVWLETIEREGRNGLRFSWRPFSGIDEDVGTPKPDDMLQLMTAPTAFRFSYLAAGTRGRGPQWIERWDRAHDLPLMVRIGGERASEDDEAWPDLLLPVRIEAEHDCVLPRDAVLRRCRLDRR